MMDVLPVNPEVLKWARETLGLSHAEVAEKLGRKTIDGDTISDWEDGQGSPTYSQLEVLAHSIYRRPLAVFFFPVVPHEETPKTEFRTLPDTAIEDLPPRMMLLYRKAKLFQTYLAELFHGEAPVDSPLLHRFRMNEANDQEWIASEIRRALGISIEEQMEWLSTETAVKRWREALEQRGVFVFKDAFKQDEYSGFSLYDRLYPILFANNSMPSSRQVFTLFHELAHLLLHSGGIDFRRREPVRSLRSPFSTIEAACNRFASEFLVPDSVFDQLDPLVSEAQLSRLAERFSVSREVILRKYLDRGLVDNEYYDRMSSEWAEHAKASRSESSGGNYYYNVRTYLGDRYIGLVYRQYYQNRIGLDTVAEYLRVSPRNLSTLEHVVFEGGRP